MQGLVVVIGGMVIFEMFWDIYVVDIVAYIDSRHDMTEDSWIWIY